MFSFTPLLPPPFPRLIDTNDDFSKEDITFMRERILGSKKSVAYDDFLSMMFNHDIDLLLQAVATSDARAASSNARRA